MRNYGAKLKVVEIVGDRGKGGRVGVRRLENREQSLKHYLVSGAQCPVSILY